MSSEITQRLFSLRPILNDICNIAGIPGVSLGVALEGEVIFQENLGFGDVDKVFTASAIGILVDEGKLNWTTPLVSIIPELDAKDKSLTEQLTILDLLTHRTGQANSNNWWFGPDGVLLKKKSETVSAFNALEQVSPFRSGFQYSNWNFSLAGEVIERLSGMSYGNFVQSRIFEPLQMQRTTTKHTWKIADNFAKPYAALDDKSMYLLPPPPFQDGTIMVAAQGIQNSVNDLLKFSSALLGARKGDSHVPLKNTDKQFAGHIFRGRPFLNESYGLGLARTALPGTIGGGSSGMYATLPVITPGANSNAHLVAFHSGRQAGYTSFLTMLPELDISIVILTNSIGLGDPTCWIHELLVETLVESTRQTDFVSLATEAAKNAIASIPRMKQDLELSRQPDATPGRDLKAFKGFYYSDSQNFIVEIRLKDDTTLQVAFQALDSQLWDLEYYQGNTFSWLPSRDDIVKRARFPYAGKNVYTLIFQSDSDGQVNGLLWPHDPSILMEKQLFRKLQDTVYSSMEAQEHEGSASESWSSLRRK